MYVFTKPFGHHQDETQCQFFSRVVLAWIPNFQSPILVAYIYPLLRGEKSNSCPFPKALACSEIQTSSCKNEEND